MTLVASIDTTRRRSPRSPEAFIDSFNENFENMSNNSLSFYEPDPDELLRVGLVGILTGLTFKLSDDAKKKQNPTNSNAVPNPNSLRLDFPNPLGLDIPNPLGLNFPNPIQSPINRKPRVLGNENQKLVQQENPPPGQAPSKFPQPGQKGTVQCSI